MPTAPAAAASPGARAQPSTGGVTGQQEGHWHPHGGHIPENMHRRGWSHGSVPGAHGRCGLRASTCVWTLRCISASCVRGRQTGRPAPSPLGSAHEAGPLQSAPEDSVPLGPATTSTAQQVSGLEGSDPKPASLQPPPAGTDPQAWGKHPNKIPMSNPHLG